MSDKNSVKVKIFGSEYQVKGEADPAYMETLARLVDEKMREIAQPGSAQSGRAAILAAFNLADELMKARKALQEKLDQQEDFRKQAVDLDLQLQDALYPGLAPAGEELSLPLESGEEEVPEPPLDLLDYKESGE